MTFLNPALLWGMLAVAIPIALHFWHQQRAKPMPWVMLRWLETPNQPPKRGFRFDNWLLLALRCLLLITLACLLARPSWPDKQITVPTRGVHLVAPEKPLVDAYRFELEQAQQRGEPLFWATQPLSAITALNEPPPAQPLNPLTLQTAIDEAANPQTGLHLYLHNASVWADAPVIQVPRSFTLHQARAATAANTAYLALPSGKRLTLANNGRLALVEATDKTAQPVATAPLRVLVQLSNAAGQATVRAALGALTQVYGLTYHVDEQPVATVSYTWIITDKPIGQPVPGTIYTLIGQPLRPDWPNVQYLPGPLTTQASADVANGQLPEQLGTQLVRGLGLLRGPAPLSQPAFAALFTPADGTKTATLPAAYSRNTFQNGLLVLFLSLLLAERWLARRQGA